MSTRREIVQSFVAQLDRPSALDRNKALFGLNALLDADATLTEQIAESACARVVAIAQSSVMPNVGGLAKSLLTRLDRNPPQVPASRCASDAF